MKVKTVYSCDCDLNSNHALHKCIGPCEAVPFVLKKNAKYTRQIHAAQNNNLFVRRTGRPSQSKSPALTQARF
jgi:hypothetical protein